MSIHLHHRDLECLNTRPDLQRGEERTGEERARKRKSQKLSSIYLNILNCSYFLDVVKKCMVILSANESN